MKAKITRTTQNKSVYQLLMILHHFNIKAHMNDIFHSLEKYTKLSKAQARKQRRKYRG